MNGNMATFYGSLKHHFIDFLFQNGKISEKQNAQNVVKNLGFPVKNTPFDNRLLNFSA